MRKENIGLAAFGVILFLIGLFAFFYAEEGKYPNYSWEKTYPYREISLPLIIAGIALVFTGFFVSLIMNLKE